MQHNMRIISDVQDLKSAFFCHNMMGVPRGLSGYRARRRVADSRRPVLMAGLSLNFK